MHGPPEIASAQRQIDDALELIAPVPEHRDKCRREVVLALKSVDFWRTIYDRRSPATRKKQYTKLAKTLRKAEIAIEGQVLPVTFLQEMRQLRNEYERAADAIAVRRRDARKQDNLKCLVTARAKKLLIDFGKPAYRARNSLWHKLSNNLYGGDANLFEFLGRQPKFRKQNIFGEATEA